MAIKFQYNKTSLGELGKQLKMRQKALPTIKSKESALRSEVKKAKDTAQDFQRQLDALTAQYDYMVSLWGEFDADLLRIADVDLAEQKIAGVRTPVLQDIRFEEKDYDLFSAPVWFADGYSQAPRAPGYRVRGVQPQDGVAGFRTPQDYSEGKPLRKGADTRVRGCHTQDQTLHGG